MTVTLLTGTNAIDLTADPYGLVNLDVGEDPKQMNWFQPPIAGTIPQLATSFDQAVQMVITLRVISVDALGLQGATEGIIAEFVDANTIDYSLGGPVVTLNTFPSNIEPLDLSDENLLFVAADRYVLPRWTFSVWREPIES